MKQYLSKLVITGAVAAAMALAQTPAPAPAPQQGPAKTAVRPRAMRRQRTMQALNLTPAQRQQAKAIFQQARQSAQPLRQELKQNREALAAAVKVNDTAQIQTLAARQGNLMGQAATIRSESMAKFYSTLTPDQRTKLDQMHQRIHQRMQQHRQAING